MLKFFPVLVFIMLLEYCFLEDCEDLVSYCASAISAAPNHCKSVQSNLSTVCRKSCGTCRSISNQGPNATDMDCNCSCPFKKWKPLNLTTIEAERIRKEVDESIRRNISVDKTQVSSYIRRKTCARDDRPSAGFIGKVAIVFVSIVFGFVIALDFLPTKSNNTIHSEQMDAEP